MAVRINLPLFLIVIISSNAEKVKNLNITEGGSITFPEPVFELGFLISDKQIIATVAERKFKILGEPYKDRLFWNNTTGLFTITRLQRNDSGNYKIQSTKAPDTVYKLAVFESVTTPSVNKVSVSAESCTLLCTVENATESTLFWYKDEEIVNQSSSSLALPLTILTQDYSSSYKCEAANPADRKTREVSVTVFCSVNKIPDTNQGIDVARVVIPTLSAVLVILAGIFLVWKFKTRHTEDIKSTEPEVVYTDVHIVAGRCQGRSSPNPTRPIDRSNLTTVYDKLENFRMIQPDTA